MPSQPQLTDAEKIRGLPLMIAGGALNAAFCALTLFGSVFVLFLDELGLPKARIGFVLSLIPFSAMVAVFVAPTVARVGYKRIFLTFYGIRKGFTALVLFTPLVLSRYGSDVAFYWVSGIVLAFALCRAIAETGIMPWLQELVPFKMRGKFDAIGNIVGRSATITAIAIAGYVVSHGTGTGRFIWLMAGGILLGVTAVVMRGFVPGGAPLDKSKRQPAGSAPMFAVLRDKGFRTFLTANSLATLGLAPLYSFVPLFMKEQVGLDIGTIVYLEIAVSAGSLLFGYAWGWAGDRFGSKPVMLSGLTIAALMPVLWIAMPRFSVFSLPVAMTISFMVGAGHTAWGLGYFRYLFVSAVPPEKKTEYLAVQSAWLGLTNGMAPLLGGALLQFTTSRSEMWKGSFLFFSLDPYTPLFILSIILVAAAALTIRKVPGHGELPLGRFIGMFFEGNPLTAVGGMLRYHAAGSETDRVSTTQRMGDSGNPLSLDELLEALEDPGFNVRYEAVIALARLRPRRRIIDALVRVLEDSQPDLSIAAAWALGKLGDRRAIPALRVALQSDYPLLRARCARALALLNDRESIPVFRQNLYTEPTTPLRIAHASALGLLRDEQSVGYLLDALRDCADSGLREEIALSIARIIGDERAYIRLWRSTRRDSGTAIAQALHGLDSAATVDVANAFGRGDYPVGRELLGRFISARGTVRGPMVIGDILSECARGLVETDTREYLLLAVHALKRE